MKDTYTGDTSRVEAFLKGEAIPYCDERFDVVFYVKYTRRAGFDDYEGSTTVRCENILGSEIERACRLKGDELTAWLKNNTSYHDEADSMRVYEQKPHY